MSQQGIIVGMRKIPEQTNKLLPTADAAPKQALYRSGVAARLAGIPVGTLRVWERRYSVSDPQVSGRGRRLYSTQNIERLRLVKQLVDAGNPVGSIAGLPLEALLEVRAATTGFGASAATPAPVTAVVRIAIVGAISRLRWHPGLSVVGECSDLDKAPEALRDVQADIIVFEQQSLLDLAREEIEVIKRVTDASAVIILYRFAPGEKVRRLRKEGYVVAHANLDADEIELLCRTALSVHPAKQAAAALPVPGVRFDIAALETLAGTSNAIYCECPKHLAEILLTVGSFERYCLECRNRSPADAELHQNLLHAAGQARACLEAALLQIVVAEGLPLPRRVAAATP